MIKKCETCSREYVANENGNNQQLCYICRWHIV